MRAFLLESVAVKQVAKTSEDAAFFAAAAELRAVLDDAAGQAADRERLQPNFPRPAHEGEEQSFAAEDARPEAALKVDADTNALGRAEQVLADEDAFAGIHQPAEEAALIGGGGAIRFFYCNS
jgi:hypothetical protein